MNITPSTEHKCPWLELPWVEAKFQQQYQTELDLLKTSELELTTERNRLNQELQQSNQAIQDLCEYWGVSNLNELNRKITEGVRERNTYLGERDQARQEIIRLQKEKQEIKAEIEWWKGETNTIANKLNIRNQEELDQLLKGQTLKQIIQERERTENQAKNTEINNRRIFTNHRVNNLKELGEKLTKTEKLLSQEQSWWNRWFVEPDQLKVNVPKRDGANTDYALQVWEQTNSLDLEEQPHSKRGRKNIQAIYKHYINSPTAEESSLDELDNKISELISINYTSQQIADLRELFIANRLVQTYNFIQEISDLTNPHRIKKLERNSEELKQDLDEKTGEELKEQAHKLAPLLEACALPETRDLLVNGFAMWAELLERVEDLLKEDENGQENEELESVYDSAGED